MNAATGLFATVFVALYAGHQVGDLWVQRSSEALGKHRPGRPGRLACARHTVTVTLTLAAFLAVTAAVTGAGVSVAATAAGLAVNAVSHYWADRRSTLARLAALAGKGEFYAFGAPRPGRDDNATLGTGAFHLDQAWHVTWLLVTALIIAGGSR